MEAEESTLVAMSMDGKNVEEFLNSVMRNAITISVKKNFITKLEKYFDRVAKTINRESIGDVAVSFSFKTEEIDSGITSGIVAAVAGTILEMPIVGIIVYAVLDLLKNKMMEGKRERQKQEVRQKIRSELFPQVMMKVGSEVETTVAKQINEVNLSIDKEIINKRETLEKAMSDLKQQINSEKEKKEKLILGIKSDLEVIWEIKRSLR